MGRGSLLNRLTCAGAHGAADGVNHPDTSADKEQLFRGPCHRKLIEGIGDFPQREATLQVTAELNRFLLG